MTYWKRPDQMLLKDSPLPSKYIRLFNEQEIRTVKDLCEMEEGLYWNLPFIDKKSHEVIEKHIEDYLTSHMDKPELPQPTAFHIAQYFIDRCHEERRRGNYQSLTNLKLQKLLYYSQGFYLAIYNKPLFPDRIEAWVHGPTVPSVYKRLQRYGYNTIPEGVNVFIDEDTGKSYSDTHLIEYNRKMKIYNDWLESIQEPVATDKTVMQKFFSFLEKYKDKFK